MEAKAKELQVTDKRMVAEVVEAPTMTNNIVLMAMQKNYSPEFIEKMMDLQERHEKNEARKAFHRAMSAFKANPPKVFRDLQAKYQMQGKPETKWNHADLGTASDAISVGLGEHGLNSSWRTEPQENGNIKVTCVITHEMGHSESTWLAAGPDKTGSKNEIQAVGSTIFYLERYTLFAITGIAPARMDDNGAGTGSPPEYIDEKQLGQIRDMMLSTGANSEKFLALFSAESDEKILAKDFGKAMTALKAKQRAMEKKERESGGNDK
uniref:Putative Erf family protein n=1 Tax=viral metagenome TaxID=1070528 RepID=A0A6M3JZQ7_9ZZZZ